jgi:hypothetical protein
MRMWIGYIKYYAILYMGLEQPPIGGLGYNPLKILKEHWIYKLCERTESICTLVMD